MAYDSNTKKMTAPIRVGEVADALGESSLDVGTLCSSDKVNRDSMLRPYECGKQIISSEEFLAGGEDGFFGYTIPVTSNSNSRDLWTQTWQHRVPTDYFHLLMFDGYSHAASWDEYPFRMRIQKAGSAWVVEYECHNDVEDVVNPGKMNVLKDYYPAFQVFAKGTPDTIPASTPVFSWCGQYPISQGRSGEYLYDMNMIANQTYYVIPFLSQYKFSPFSGSGSISGKKYALVYKEFNVTDWAISQGAISVTKYEAWIMLDNLSSYAIQATFGYRFFVDNLYIAPTYRYSVYNTNGQMVYNQSAWTSVTPSFYGEVGTTYEFIANISKVNSASGQPWQSGYIIRVFHKEQTGADGTNKEFYEDFIIP